MIGSRAAELHPPAHEKQGLYPLWLAFVDRHPFALIRLNRRAQRRAPRLGESCMEPRSTLM